MPLEPCRHCGAPLTDPATRPPCARSLCRLDGLANDQQRAVERATLEATRAAEAYGRSHAEARGLKDGTLVAVVLPAFTEALEPASRARAARLAAHVARAVSEATDLGSHEEGRDAGADDRLAKACAVCGGHCCRFGGEHAYIRPATIRRLVASGVITTEADAIPTYAAHVPSAVQSGSCIFHGERGCGLPRAMRAATCNDYVCDGAARLRAVGQEVEAVALVAVRGGVPVRARVVLG